jgi:hypothetical protein
MTRDARLDSVRGRNRDCQPFQEIMNAPIAEFADYGGLRRALNAARDHRKLSLETMNELVACPDGYFQKLLGTRPIRRIGLQSLGWAFGALGVKCVVVEDPETWARIQRQPDYETRDEAHFQSAVRGGTTEFRLSRRHMSIIQAKGRKNRWEKMTPVQRTKWAKQMNKSRWKKIKQRARQRKASHKARKSNG